MLSLFSLQPMQNRNELTVLNNVDRNITCFNIVQNHCWHLVLVILCSEDNQKAHHRSTRPITVLQVPCLIIKKFPTD